MTLEFVSSEKGKQKLVDSGHLYVMDRRCGEKMYWKCDQNQKCKCRARAHTMNNEVIKRIGEHNHAGNSARVEVTKVVNGIKVKAISTQNNPQQIVADAFFGLSRVAAGQMPSLETLKKNIRNARREAHRPLTNPILLTDLIIPKEFLLTHKGDAFLMSDVGDGSDRMLIFGTEQNLQLLSKSICWFVDGTFKTVPLFSQLYVILGVVGERIIPFVYALLPSATQETYNRLISQLKNANSNLSPASIMTDFELSAVNAFKHHFPESKPKGCFFHFCQSLWRNIQGNGLQHRYENDKEFAIQLRMVAALAFVPVSDVVSSFEQLLDFLPENSQPFLDYFEDTWIGRPYRHGRRPPRFPHNLWNCYEDDLTASPKTNNSCEVWHRSFSESIGANHSNIWKFIQVLKNEQALSEDKFEQQVAGINPNISENCYRDASVRLQTILKEYDEQNVVGYLRGLAHNFNF